MLQQLCKTAITASGSSTWTDLWSKGVFSSCDAPLLSLCLRQASTQLPEQRPPAAEKPQGTQEMHASLAGLTQDQQETWASPNWQLALAGNPKASQTVLDISVQATELDPLCKSQHQHMPAMPSTLLSHTATVCSDSTKQQMQLLLQKPKQNTWGRFLVLFSGSALSIVTKLTLLCHAQFFQAMTAAHWWGWWKILGCPSLFQG